MHAVFDIQPLRAEGGGHDGDSVREGLEDLHPGPAAVTEGDHGHRACASSSSMDGTSPTTVDNARLVQSRDIRARTADESHLGRRDCGPDERSDGRRQPLRRVDVGWIPEVSPGRARPGGLLGGRFSDRASTGRGYVFGITATFGSPDRAASRALAITTRSTWAATERWNRRQSLPLSRTWYQAKRLRREIRRARRTAADLASSSARSRHLTSSRLSKSTMVGPEVRPTQPLVRARGREPHDVIGRKGPLAQC